MGSHATSLEAGLGERSLALVVLGDDARCIHASPEACSLLGVTREQALAMRLVDLLAEDERDLFDHVWRSFRRGGGRAGPFRLGGPRQIEVEIDISSEILPSRHLVLLTPAGSRRPRENPLRWRGERRAERAPTPTAREREVLTLLAAGATDEEVASELDLSIATVRTHVRNAKAKLGAQTRVQAVALALSERLIRLA